MAAFQSIASNKREKRVDLPLILAYLFLIGAGWVNIYSAVYSEEHTFIFDFTQRYGMQFIWICLSLLTAIVVLYIIKPSIYATFSPFFYVVMLVLLFAVTFLGREVHGSKSWFFIGSFGIQPAEFSKITTSLLLAAVMGQYGFSLSNKKDLLKAAMVVIIPIVLIIMERETGSALVYLGLILVFYLMGMSGWVIIMGLSIIAIFIMTILHTAGVAILYALGAAFILKLFIDGSWRFFLSALPLFVLCAFIPKLEVLEIGEYTPLGFLTCLKRELWTLLVFIPHLFIWAKELLGIKLRGRTKRNSKWLLVSLICAVIVTFGVNFMFNKVLQTHQKARIENLLGITEDLQGIGYNVHQSKIAIGSGGFAGKGFLNGTQTKYNFVPEQSTDFIFCTVGEEWGFIGSMLVLIVYIFLIIRIILLASKNEEPFVKIYGWCVASIFAMHVFINMGMTMGIVPVIGIPLPFLSYGGSSMLSFTLLLFIFIRLDMSRQKR